VYFDRLRSCKFSMGASADWQRASERWADRQLRARKRRAGSVLKLKQSTGERCRRPMSSLTLPCRVPTNPCNPADAGAVHITDSQTHRLTPRRPTALRAHDPAARGPVKPHQQRTKPTSPGAASVIISVPACGVRMLSRMRRFVARTLEESTSWRVGSRPKALVERGQLGPSPSTACAACPPAPGMGAKKRTSRTANVLLCCRG
jgi:hypothetical protein